MYNNQKLQENIDEEPESFTNTMTETMNSHIKFSRDININNNENANEFHNQTQELIEQLD